MCQQLYSLHTKTNKIYYMRKLKINKWILCFYFDYIMTGVGALCDTLTMENVASLKKIAQSCSKWFSGWPSNFVENFIDFLFGPTPIRKNYFGPKKICWFECRKNYFAAASGNMFIQLISFHWSPVSGIAKKSLAWVQMRSGSWQRCEGAEMAAKDDQRDFCRIWFLLATSNPDP